jgi:hypothetical protein
MTKNFYLPFATAVVVGLLFSYIGTIHCHMKIKKFTNKLDQSQLVLYQNVRKRRMWYFLIGILIALLGSILYFCLSKDLIYNRIMTSLIILLLTPMIVYTLFPKSPYMLEQSNINTTETHDWFKVYVCMKNGMIYGFCIGFLITLIITSIFYRA